MIGSSRPGARSSSWVEGGGREGHWVFPLGHYLGPFHPHRDAPVAYHRIRVGEEAVRLFSEDELAAWLLAHGLPGTVADQPWTREAMAVAAREQGGDDRATALSGAVTELLTEGVLIEVPDGSRAAREFATSYRFCPLLVGLGVDPRQPDQVVIGLTGNPIVTIDQLGYEVWLWSPAQANLWELSRSFAEVGDRLAGTATLPEDMLAQVLRRVHRLLAHGAGYLDVAS